MTKTTRKFIAILASGLMLSEVGALTAHAEEVTSNYTSDETITYYVEKGDTLGKICKKYYGNSGYWEELAEYNNLDNPNDLYIGEQIIIPITLDDTTTYIPYAHDYEEDAVYYVEKGDTLSRIVNKLYGISSKSYVDKLATYNNLDDPNTISVGQKLYIPYYAKLEDVTAYDYSDQYARMKDILEHDPKKNDKPKDEAPHFDYVIPPKPENGEEKHDGHHEPVAPEKKLIKK